VADSDRRFLSFGEGAGLKTLWLSRTGLHASALVLWSLEFLWSLDLGRLELYIRSSKNKKAAFRERGLDQLKNKMAYC
jgi:hypothetical protein